MRLQVGAVHGEQQRLHRPGELRCAHHHLGCEGGRGAQSTRQHGELPRQLLAHGSHDSADDDDLTHGQFCARNRHQ